MVAGFGMPSSRDTFKSFCLRRLGSGVIEVNLSDEQVEDCVNIAIQYWQDFHTEGTKLTYYKWQLSAQDITNQYIILPPDFVGAFDLFALGDVYGMQNMFNIRYQIALNDLYTLTSVSMVPYFMALSQLQFMEELLIGQQPIRYNRYDNKVHIDQDWSFVAPGQFLIIKAYLALDPDYYVANNLGNPWQDRYLWRYATAMMKRDWGSNLKKYGDMKLPDGNVIKGQQIFNEAIIEIKELEQEMVDTWSPLGGQLDMIG